MVDFQKVKLLKVKLETAIVGAEKPEWSCCCGSLSKPRSTVIEVQPPSGNHGEDQFNLWYMWSVCMRDSTKTSGRPDYYTGLSVFLSVEEITAIFGNYLPLSTPEELPR